MFWMSLTYIDGCMHNTFSLWAHATFFLSQIFSLLTKPFINKNIDSLKIVTISKSGVRYMENQFYEGILQTLLIFVDDKDV